MAAIATLLVVLTISLLTVRVATVMLVLTGLSLPLARFQARSAFTGCGYTTIESEQLVGHPVRRRIISTLMLMGNAGIVTTVGTLIAGLVAIDQSGVSIYLRLLVLAAGVATLWAVASSKFIERLINRWTFKLLRRYTKIEVRDYANLMHLSGDYGISELRVDSTDWLANRPLRELRLPREGVIVLGITRADGSYVGAPQANTEAAGGDTMILYGRTDRLAELDTRRADRKGVLKHVEAVADQKVRTADTKATDAKTPEERAKAEKLKASAEKTLEAVSGQVSSDGDGKSEK